MWPVIWSSVVCTPAIRTPLLRLLADDLRLRRPMAGEVTDILASVGWRALTPIEPPPQEASPRWRAGKGLRHRNFGIRHPSAGITTYRTVLRAEMRYQDYRNVTDRQFAAASSIGMTEHSMRR